MTGKFFHLIKSCFLVDHYYDITASKMAFQFITTTTKKDFRCSDFTYGIKKDHNVENRNINYLWRITYGYQGLWGVNLRSIRLGQVRLGQVRLGQARLGSITLSQVRLGQDKSGQRVFKYLFLTPKRQRYLRHRQSKCENQTKLRFSMFFSFFSTF